jgi:hypothetical protein
MGLHWLLTGPDWSAGSVQSWMLWLEQWSFPVWLAAWLPMDGITALKAWLTMLGPWVEGIAVQAPRLLGWLVPLVWIGWGLGLVALVMLGLAGSVLVVAVRRPRRTAAA